MIAGAIFSFYLKHVAIAGIVMYIVCVDDST